MKEEKTRNGGTFDGHTTLRRNAAAKHSAAPLTELQKIRRQNVDSGYSTSDGYDKRWSQELPGSNGNGNGTTASVTDNGNPSKWSPTQTLLHNDKHTPTSYTQFQSQSSGNSTPTLSSPAGSANNNNNNSNQSDDFAKLTAIAIDNSTPKRSNSNGSTNNRLVSCDLKMVSIHAKRFISCRSIHFHQLASEHFQHHITYTLPPFAQLSTPFHFSHSFGHFSLIFTPIISFDFVIFILDLFYFNEINFVCNYFSFFSFFLCSRFMFV